MCRIVEKIISDWGIKHAAVIQRHPAVWEIDGQYMLKAYENEDSIKRNAQMLTVLYEHGAPVAQLLPSLNKDSYVKADEKYWLMTTKLAGSNIIDIRQSGMAYKMGETIARLHVIFQKCEDEMDFENKSLLDEMNGWINENLTAQGWKLISEQEFWPSVERLANVYCQLPKQLIHRDVHFGNFLFSDGVFSGYIDFDLSQKNIRVFDLAYFLTGLLTSENGSELQEDQWLEIIRSVISGYESVLKLLKDEKDILVCVMECIEILFVAYFISIENMTYAEDAAKIFHYIQKREQKVQECLL